MHLAYEVNQNMFVATDKSQQMAQDCHITLQSVQLASTLLLNMYCTPVSCPVVSEHSYFKMCKYSRYVTEESGFGGLGVACWPLVPKFAGSNPAEAVGFLGRKNPQHTFLRRGSKAVGPMMMHFSVKLCDAFTLEILPRSELQNLSFKLHFTSKLKDSFQIKAVGHKKWKFVYE